MPNLPYQTATWDTHLRVNREIDYPLLNFGESTHFTVRDTFEGPFSNYAPVALNTAHATYGTAYLVQQSPLRQIDGAQVRYERLYSTVPPSWVDPESYAYTFPGYDAGASSASVVVNGITASGANTVFTTATNSGAVATDSVSISVSYTRNGKVQTAVFSGLAVATTSSSQVTVERTLPGTGAFSVVSGTAAKMIPGVPTARSLIVGSRVLHDYALSSDAALATDLPIAPLFSPLTDIGVFTDWLTSTSSPTASAYRALITSGGELVAESSRSRYLGNIYVRMTRMLPAS